MGVHTITLSKNLYSALQYQAARHRQTPDSLVEGWLKQRLDLEHYPGLEWRQGEGGWRTGIKDAAIDVYTVVGYSQAGYSAQEIAADLLPKLSYEQVQTALRYYADHPKEIDESLAENEPEIAKARLYRTLGPDGYRRVTGKIVEPVIIQETRAKYNNTDAQG